MRTSALISSIVASAALMGCGTFQTQMIPPTAASCENTKVCFIPVTVVNCKVSIPPEKEYIVMKGKFVAILWGLDKESLANKYLFGSVDLKAGTPDTDHWFFGKQFSGQGAILNGAAYGWIDKNSNYNAYDYSITILDGNNGNKACPPLDPHIINN